MQIYSSFSLKVSLPEGTEHPDNTELDIIEDLRDNNDSASYAINEDGTTRDETVWAEVDRDMKAFSEKYPKVVFILSTESSDPEDFGYGMVETKYCAGKYVD